MPKCLTQSMYGESPVQWNVMVGCLFLNLNFFNFACMGGHSNMCKCTEFMRIVTQCYFVSWFRKRGACGVRGIW